MKDWIAATLFRRLATFGRGAPVAVGVITLATAGTAWATDYSAGTSCGQSSQYSGSPVPVPIVTNVSETSGTSTGGSAYPGPPLRFGALTAVAAPNFLGNDLRTCGTFATANLTDVIVSGPASTVLATVHVPFHANIYQYFVEMTDGHSQVWSSTSANLQFTVSLTNPNVLTGGTFAQGALEVRLNRQGQIAQVLPGAVTNGKVVPKPRIAGLESLDPDGFITKFFQQSLPVTGGPGNPFAGFATSTIDEVRGEIVFTTTVETNQPLKLSFNAAISSFSIANFIAGSFGAIDEGRLGLPSDGSVVFELPPGYTVDVPSAGVIDNVVPQVFECPKTSTTWRSRPADWPLTSMSLGNQVYTQNQLLGILQMAPTALRPDASVVIAQQLIAARLNEANGAAPGPMLQPSMVADTLLDGFGGKVPYRVMPNTTSGQRMMNIALELSRYNAGQLTSTCTP